MPLHLNQSLAAAPDGQARLSKGSNPATYRYLRVCSCGLRQADMYRIYVNHYVLELLCEH